MAMFTARTYIHLILVISNPFLGSGPDRGRSPVKWGDFPSVHPSIRTSMLSPLEGPRASQAGLRPSQAGLRASQAGLRARQAGLRASQPGLKGSEACLAGSEAWLDGSKACLAGSWALEGGNGRTDERTENLPILQDFVPYRGRYPKRTSYCSVLVFHQN